MMRASLHLVAMLRVVDPLLGRAVRGIIRRRPPVAQWIRATDFGSVGRGFESLRAGHSAAMLPTDIVCKQAVSGPAPTGAPPGRCMRVASPDGEPDSRELERPRRMSMNIRAICVPSSDWAFARVVDRMLGVAAISSPRGLEQQLKPLYPQARVRRRELSGEPQETWYVYRDRRFPSRSDETS